MVSMMPLGLRCPTVESPYSVDEARYVPYQVEESVQWEVQEGNMSLEALREALAELVVM